MKIVSFEDVNDQFTEENVEKLLEYIDLCADSQFGNSPCDLVRNCIKKAYRAAMVEGVGAFIFWLRADSDGKFYDRLSDAASKKWGENE